MLRTVVTGGAGFIGSHLCSRLLNDGHYVICVDNLLTGSEENIADLRKNPRFLFIRHDISEPLALETDAIFHLASPASPVGYMQYPVATILANSMGTYHLLQMAQTQEARFLLASTSEIYGDPLCHPQEETYWGNVNSIGPRACYDESKRLGETLTMEYWRQFGVDARIVRIFNTYGPHSQILDGRMIPNFITQSLRHEPIALYGDGSQTRSICYVSDLVDGLVRAMFQPGTMGEVFNLGNPEEHTILEFASVIQQLCDVSVPLCIQPGRIDEPQRRRPDITKARAILDWQPQVSMYDGLQRTITWFKCRVLSPVTVL